MSVLHHLVPTRTDVWRLLLLIVLAVGLSGLSMLVHPRPAVWHEQMAADALSLDMIAAGQQDVLWVDARSRADYRQGHIPDAVLCNEDDWEAGLLRVLEAWQPGALVVVYCDEARCDASAAVADRLRQETGFPDIHTLHGGWQVWQDQQEGR